MKDKILKIINNNISISQSGYMNGQADIEGVEYTVSELTALMCYREVRAYYQAYRDFDDNESDESIKQEILGTFSDDYPEETILQAIEQVKNELK